MATPFAFKNKGVGMPYRAPHEAPFMAHIDIPDIIANQTLDSALPTTGFSAADVLQVFEVPAGFLLRHVGTRVTTVEGGVATAMLGNGSATETHLLAADTDGYMATTTIDLNALTTVTVDVASAHLGGDNYEGVAFVTNGTIDIYFETNLTACAIFDVWATGWRVF